MSRAKAIKTEDVPLASLHRGRAILRKRDFYAGALMILLGLGVAVKGSTYGIGSLLHMEPGFMPTVLGIILIGLGIAIGIPAASQPDGEGEDILPAQSEWWAWGCILVSPLAFILFGSYGGMIPATMACVFVAAMGDRSMTYRAAIVLSAIMAAFGVLLFHYVLQLPMPVLQWDAS